MRKDLNSITRQKMLDDMISSGTSLPDDIAKTWGSDGGFISLETFSRITGLTPYKLRKLIKANEFPFAKYVPSGTGHANERGTFLISWTGFKDWVGIKNEEATDKKVVEDLNTYSKGEIFNYYKSVLKTAEESGIVPKEFRPILVAFNYRDKNRLLEEIIKFTENVTVSYLEMFGVKIEDS